ncbi:energy transducer TonB [Desulfobacula phenolica]|uniref:Protein TonB n=1 Tax=Desulfobacula phenolica TaxID=90732 RepID=A0A1H2HK74_9BACT|nr:energy transducer TonB [Desulfobacula phenolica]SDU32281.1 protein TonB [Desulfobacula phenolica]
MAATSFRFFWGWTLALIGSVLLNITLFGLMPGLIQMVPDKPDALDDIRQIRVIRVKKPTTPPRKKEPEKIKKPDPLKKIARSHTTPLKQRPMNLKPRLDFELNPKLPAAPMDLVMPSLEHFSMNGPMLKTHYTMGELDSPITPLVKIPPIYPIRATRRGIEGAVTVQFLVTKNGTVEQISIIDAQPENIFNQSVINCVSHWKFKPGTVEGIPVATLAQTTIRFKLEQ